MSKKLITDLMKISRNVEATKKFDNGIKWKVEVEGEYQDMSNKSMTINDLAKIVNNLVKTVEAGFRELKTDIKDIKDRLDILETDVKQLKTDVKEIKSLPTIQQELKKK